MSVTQGPPLARLRRQHPLLRSQKGTWSIFVRVLTQWLKFSCRGLLRARELQAEGLAAGRYRPPALRAMASAGSPSNDVSSPSTITPVDPSPLPPTNYPSNYRRARAGTLPSNVQLAAQHFAAASESLQSLSGSTESFLETYGQQQPATASAASMAASRPALRHSASIASSAATSAITERNSRLRSGSLTLPTAVGLSNAFGGGSIFSTSWLSNSRNGGSNLGGLDEVRSVTSMDTADDYDHTLDYLGLDDNLRPHPTAATMSELRIQAQAALTSGLNNPSRLRASTVSGGPYRIRSATGSSNLLSTPNAEEEEEDMRGMLDGYGVYNGQQIEGYDNGLSQDYYAQYVAKGFKPGQHLGSNASVRPRAISVGMLDDPSRTVPRTSVLEAQSNLYGNDLLGSQNTLAGSLALAAGNTTLNKMQSGATNAARYGANAEGQLSRANSYLAAPTSQGRSLSPKSENQQNQHQQQTPTRSLWIGNLDSSVTSEQLIHVFAPYGAIESLRLLPEKVR